MSKQIDELMALARQWVEARTKGQGGSSQQDALRQALEAALGQPQAVPASSLKPGEPAQVLSIPEARDMAERLVRETADKRNWDYNRWSAMMQAAATMLLNACNTSAPPTQTPMQKIDIPPGMSDPLDVVYAEGWNGACEKFGNPVFEPTPALVIEVTKEAAPPAQTKRLDSDESRLTPQPRLKDTAVEACIKAVEDAFAWTGGHGEPSKPGPDAIANIIRSHFHVVQTPPPRLTDDEIIEIAKLGWWKSDSDITSDGLDIARAIEAAVRRQFGYE